MTQNKKFKKAVRARMTETGESYTAARLSLLREVLDRQRRSGDALGITSTPELWAAAGGTEEERPAVLTDMGRYERVYQLLCGIEKDTMFLSCRVLDHPLYVELVGLGPSIVPDLLRSLDEFEDGAGGGIAVWYATAALYTLTKADPIPKEDAGRLGKILEHWLAWGREQGIDWGGGS